MKILLVEDRVGLPLIKMMEKWGYETQLAEAGEAAWELLKT
jgi:DNA-binding response OmpR family regulator